MIFHFHFKIIVVVVSFEHMIRLLVGCYSPCTEPEEKTACFSKGDFKSDKKKINKKGIILINVGEKGKTYYLQTED